MKRVLCVLLSFSWMFALPLDAQTAAGSMDVQWDAGKADCSKDAPPPLQVHRYNDSTYILRENPCSTYEAPFMYLLIGESKALLIDTGDVADAQKMPLAATVMPLLPSVQGARMPLIVVHTHGHLDHREGDAQFASLPNVQVVGTDLDHVKAFFGFPHWPEGVAQVDLGGRVMDVLPTPGHHPSHVTYYDRDTGLVLIGDFFLPGRLIIDDADADRASAQRLVDFLRTRPVTYVLGGHVELNRHGELEDLGSTVRPDERPLPLGKDDLMNLPKVLANFNGIYGKSGEYVMYSQTRVLQGLAIAAVLLLIALVLAVRWMLRRRKRVKAAKSP
jgi:glyoxylase-like metal-dependent hydrolase (beta-lactamase superfamily II)